MIIPASQMRAVLTGLCTQVQVTGVLPILGREAYVERLCSAEAFVSRVMPYPR